MGTGSTPRRISTLVVEPPGGTLADLFTGREEFDVTMARSAQEAVDLAGKIRPDVIVADPELPDGWPVTVAETLVAKYGTRVPAIFVCRSASDAAVLEKRFDRPDVLVMVRSGLSKERLVEVVCGRVAERRAS